MGTGERGKAEQRALVAIAAAVVVATVFAVLVLLLLRFLLLLLLLLLHHNAPAVQREQVGQTKRGDVDNVGTMADKPILQIGNIPQRPDIP